VEQRGAGAPPGGLVGIGLRACNPPATITLADDVLTFAFPIQGEACCWHLDVPPVRSAARYVAWDAVEPWTFAT